MIQAMVAGLVVIPAAWLIMGSGVRLDFGKPFEFLLVGLLVGLFFSAGGVGAGLQRGANTDRPDVQPGAGADDDVRLRLLSVERAGGVPHFAHGGAGEPVGVCQRGTARCASPSGAAYEYAVGDRRAGGDRSRAAISGAQEVSPEGSKLVSVAKLGVHA